MSFTNIHYNLDSVAFPLHFKVHKICLTACWSVQHTVRATFYTLKHYFSLSKICKTFTHSILSPVYARGQIHLLNQKVRGAKRDRLTHFFQNLWMKINKCKPMISPIKTQCDFKSWHGAFKRQMTKAAWHSGGHRQTV